MTDAIDPVGFAFRFVNDVFDSAEPPRDKHPAVTIDDTDITNPAVGCSAYSDSVIAKFREMALVSGIGKLKAQ